MRCAGIALGVRVRVANTSLSDILSESLSLRSDSSIAVVSTEGIAENLVRESRITQLSLSK